jgi:hypothetical protein
MTVNCEDETYKSTKQRSVFVAMPFANHHEWVFTDIINPTLSELGYRINRVDKQDHLELITKRIIEGILSANLVTDVTQWEVGIFT